MGLVDCFWAILNADSVGFGSFGILSAGFSWSRNWDAYLPFSSSIMSLREVISFVSSRSRVDCSWPPSETDDLIGQPRSLVHSFI